jgi:hypothetical protein
MTFRRYQNRWTASIDLLFSCFQHKDTTGVQPLRGTESSSKYQPNVLSYTVTQRAQNKMYWVTQWHNVPKQNVLSYTVTQRAQNKMYWVTQWHNVPKTKCTELHSDTCPKQNPAWEADSHSATQEITPPFMELACSLPSLQQPNGPPTPSPFVSEDPF